MKFRGIVGAYAMMAAAMAGLMGLGSAVTITPGPRGDIFYPGGGFCDFGSSGPNIGAIQYARQHNRRGKIIRRNRSR